MHAIAALTAFVSLAGSTLIGHLDVLAGLIGPRGSPGAAIIVNNCPYPVSLLSVAAGNAGPVQPIPPYGSYSETFRAVPFGGVSLKLSQDADLSTNVLQFEYTLGGDSVWYDLSEINGHPFQGESAVLAPSQAPADNCLAVTLGQSFQQPGDTQFVRVCPADTDLTLTLC